MHHDRTSPPVPGQRSVLKIAGRVGLVALPLLAAAAVVAQGPGLARAISQSAHLQPGWLALTVAGMLAVYTSSWLAISVASRTPLPWRRTVAVQVAGVYLNRLVPAGLGSKVLSARYLTRNGLEGSQAAAVMVLFTVGGTIAPAVLGLAAGAFLVSSGAIGGGTLVHPLTSAAPILGGVAALVIVLSLLAPTRRIFARLVHTDRGQRVVSDGRRFAEHLRGSRRRIWTVTAILALQPVAYGLVFLLMLHASGSQVSLGRGLAVYLFGTFAASALPIVEGLGGTELALMTGLHGAGMHPSAAAGTVIAFRLVSYWAPAIPGLIAYQALRRSHAI